MTLDNREMPPLNQPTPLPVPNMTFPCSPYFFPTSCYFLSSWGSPFPLVGPGQLFCSWPTPALPSSLPLVPTATRPLTLSSSPPSGDGFKPVSVPTKPWVPVQRKLEDGVGGRTGGQAKAQAVSKEASKEHGKVSKPTKRKGRKNIFTPAEEERLIALVKQYGESSWNEISRHMGGKNRKQLREHYINYLKVPDANQPFTVEEDKAIIAAVQQYGRRWQLLADLLPARSPIMIKNRYNSKLRAKKRRIANKSPCSLLPKGLLSEEDRAGIPEPQQKQEYND